MNKLDSFIEYINKLEGIEVDAVVRKKLQGDWDVFGLEQINRPTIARRIFLLFCKYGDKQGTPLIQDALKTLGYKIDIDGVFGGYTRRLLNQADTTNFLRSLESRLLAKGIDLPYLPEEARQLSPVHNAVKRDQI